MHNDLRAKIMKIGITTSVSQGGKTGVARWIVSAVEALLPFAAEHEFHLFVLNGDLPMFEFARGAMTIHTVSDQCRNPILDVIWHQTVLQRRAAKLGLDVIHVPSYRRMPAWAPCATLATIHDLAPFRMQGKYDLARMIYGKLALARLTKRQTAVSAVSPQTARDIETFCNVPAREVIQAPNGVDRNRFQPGDKTVSFERITRKYGVANPYFVYVARIEHPAKNHLNLIRAFEKFRRETGLKRDLILAGADWHRAEVVHETAATSPFAQDIHFTGFLPDDDLHHLYRGAEAMVFPSRFEGFGIPPIEAMACGCPVVSSNAGALKDIIGHAALVIDPENIASISSAMNAIAMQKQLKANLIAKGLQWSARYTWELTAIQLMKAYESAVAMQHEIVGTTGAKGEMQRGLAVNAG